MSLGVHFIKTSKTTGTYFFQRSYGNYIVFADNLMRLDSEFYRSKGGVYRQFFSGPDITEENRNLFQVFGAAGVFLNQSFFDEGLKVETYETDFYDHRVEFKQMDSFTQFTCKQDKKKVRVYSKELCLKPNQDVYMAGVDKTSFVLDQLFEDEIHYAFFSSFEQDHMMDLSLI